MLRDCKDPDATGKSYTLDWGEWLAGRTISGSTWAVTGDVDDDALVIVNDTNDATLTTVTVSGGTLGRKYVVTNSVVVDAQTYQRSIELLIFQA